MSERERIADELVAARDPSITSVELDGEAVLYHDTLQTVSLLNTTATLVWELLDGCSDLATIAADLATITGADATVVRDDVRGVVESFARQGLLRGLRPDPDVVAQHRIDGARPAPVPGDDGVPRYRQVPPDR